MSTKIKIPLKKKVVQLKKKEANKVSGSETKLVNIKKAHLGKLGYSNVEEWMNDLSNVYIGRKLRVFIHNKVPSKEAPGTKNKGGKLDETKSTGCGSDSADARSVLDFAPGSYVDKKGFIVEYYVLPESEFANPFSIGKGQTRDDVVRMYREYILDNPELMSKLDELRGKTLGCWCCPEACHGDVLVELLSS